MNVYFKGPSSIRCLHPFAEVSPRLELAVKRLVVQPVTSWRTMRDKQRARERRKKAWWPGLYPLLKRLSLSAFVLQTDTTGKHYERFLDTRPNVTVLIGVFISHSKRLLMRLSFIDFLTVKNWACAAVSWCPLVMLGRYVSQTLCFQCAFCTRDSPPFVLHISCKRP